MLCANSGEDATGGGVAIATVENCDLDGVTTAGAGAGAATCFTEDDLLSVVDGFVVVDGL